MRRNVGKMGLNMMIPSFNRAVALAAREPWQNSRTLLTRSTRILAKPEIRVARLTVSPISSLPPHNALRSRPHSATQKWICHFGIVRLSQSRAFIAYFVRLGPKVSLTRPLELLAIGSPMFWDWAKPKNLAKWRGFEVL